MYWLVTGLVVLAISSLGVITGSPGASAQAGSPDCNYSSAIIDGCDTTGKQCTYSSAIINGCDTTGKQCTYSSAIIDGCDTTGEFCTYSSAIIDGCVITTGGCTHRLGIIDNCVDFDGGPQPAERGRCIPVSANGGRCATVVGPRAGNPPIAAALTGAVVSLSIPNELVVELDATTDVSVQYNPVVFDGPLPTNQLITFNLPADRNSILITFSATLTNGAPYIETTTLARPQSVVGSTAAPQSAEPVPVPATATPTTPPTSQATASTTEPTGGLAVTGSTSVPLIILAQTAVGVGSVSLGTARLVRRRRDD